jgi:hypothetical protein
MSALTDLGWGLVVSVITGLALLLALTALPRMRGDRVRQQPQPRRPPAGGNDDDAPVLMPGPTTEQQLLNAKQAHDDLLAEALDFWRQARGHHHESVFLLERALAKVDDAQDARPDSFDATKLTADLQLDLAQEVEPEQTVAHLEAAVAVYEAAIGYRRGNIDSHVGLGWALMLLAHRTGAPADCAAAVAVFERAAEVSPRNLHVLRGWGVALDGLLRVVPDDADEAVVRYRKVVGEHPVAGRDLDGEFYERRRAEAWVIPPVPPRRDA